jgi:hypothetical protein
MHQSCLVNTQLLFMSVGWDCVSELQPPVDLLFIPYVIFMYGAPVEYLQTKSDELRAKPVPVTLSTTNPTWTDTSANPGQHNERLATNCLSHGMASKHIYQAPVFHCHCYCTSTSLRTVGDVIFSALGNASSSIQHCSSTGHDIHCYMHWFLLGYYYSKNLNIHCA